MQTIVAKIRAKEEEILKIARQTIGSCYRSLKIPQILHFDQQSGLLVVVNPPELRMLIRLVTGLRALGFDQRVLGTDQEVIAMVETYLGSKCYIE